MFACKVELGGAFHLPGCVAALDKHLAVDFTSLDETVTVFEFGCNRDVADH